MIARNDVENCAQLYPMKPHQRGAYARNGLPYEADIQSPGQPHIYWQISSKETQVSQKMATSAGQYLKIWRFCHTLRCCDDCDERR